VRKSRPKKPGNRVEGKTAMTPGLDLVGGGQPKAAVVAKGRSFKEVFQGKKSNDVQHK
jgi:urocanate hydratase